MKEFLMPTVAILNLLLKPLNHFMSWVYYCKLFNIYAFESSYLFQVVCFIQLKAKAAAIAGKMKSLRLPLCI
jgi:hypothetical protein